MRIEVLEHSSPTGKKLLSASVIIEEDGEECKYFLIRGLPGKKTGNIKKTYYIAKLKAGSKFNIPEEQLKSLLYKCIDKKYLK